MDELTSDPEQNYQIFLEGAVDSGLVWALVTSEEEDGEFALCESEDKDNTDVMPFFSAQDFAQAVCHGEWANYQPRAIELDDFIDNWLPGMQKDGLLVGVNWTEDLEGLEQEPLELSLDLLETD
ncbi:DUF2750 domain-containing protein [Pleionea sediminis]|uniref:DUF2750 domain-containing protein n=1 Tax=Pleionea sediminis TaxID=2569479 RepID=UPI001185EB7A|nr:DUF2750 domain-containing protein [Pleionea sediminis]